MILKATENDRMRLLDYCRQAASINIFLIGDIEIHGFDTPYQEVWYLEKGTELEGILLRYHDNLILYSHCGALTPEVVLPLLETLAIRVISGQSDVVAPLYPLLSDHFRKREMVFCELADPTALIAHSAEVQIATTDDAARISEAYGQIAEFAGLYSSDPVERALQIENRIRSGEGTHLFLKKDGQLISHGNTTAENSLSAMIGGIFTLPDQRGQGYAKTIVSALCQSLLAKNKSVCLFYDNPSCKHLFESLGFKAINHWMVLGRYSK